MISIIETLSSLEIDYEALADLVGLITSILTLLIVYVLGRPAFVRWRKKLSINLIILWISSILIFIHLILKLKIAYIFLIFGFAFWLPVFIYTIIIFYNILNLELIQFSKRNELEFNEFITDSFGSECIDAAIKEAENEEDNGNHKKEMRLYPLILAADEYWRPWSIAQELCVNSLLNIEKPTGIIYFSFTRPYDHIKEQLEHKIGQIRPNVLDKSPLLNNVIIIDCFTPLSSKISRDSFSLKSIKDLLELKKWTQRNSIKNSYLIADPRNPHLLNEDYEKALAHFNKKKYKRICVIYDALSDFLCFTDKQIAIQYLRHNMSWEERHNVSSFYILRLNTLQNKFFQEYVLWFANTVLYLEVRNEKPILKTRGLFKEPKCYDIDYKMHIVKK